MKDFFAEKSEVADIEDVRSEIDQVVSSIEDLTDADRPEAVSYVMERLDAMLGDEVLEYILVILGTRLRYGRW